MGRVHASKTSNRPNALEQDGLRNVTVRTIEELEKKVLAGLKSLAEGRGVEVHVALKEIKATIQSKQHGF